MSNFHFNESDIDRITDDNQFEPQQQIWLKIGAKVKIEIGVMYSGTPNSGERFDGDLVNATVVHVDEWGNHTVHIDGRGEGGLRSIGAISRPQKDSTHQL